MPGSIRRVELAVRFYLAMIRIIKISAWLAAGLPLMLGAASTFAQAQVPPTGDVQVFRNALETVFVFPRVGPVDKKGELVAAADLTGQVRQALVNLRLMASRVGVAPAHFVTLTIYGADSSLREVLEKSAREAFSDWGPATAFVEAKNLRPTGALVEVEAVAVVRGLKPGK